MRAILVTVITFAVCSCLSCLVMDDEGHVAPERLFAVAVVSLACGAGADRLLRWAERPAAPVKEYSAGEQPRPDRR